MGDALITRLYNDLQLAGFPGGFVNWCEDSPGSLHVELVLWSTPSGADVDDACPVPHVSFDGRANQVIQAVHSLLIARKLWYDHANNCLVCQLPRLYCSVGLPLYTNMVATSSRLCGANLGEILAWHLN